MGIRETMNENRSVTIGAAIGVTVLAILWIVLYSMSEQHGPDVPATLPAGAAADPRAAQHGSGY